MSSSSSPPGAEPPSTLAAEGRELAQAHLARWLDELLPPGPCLVWAGGVTLAAVLAADRRRTVLLVEPRTADVEEATRQARAGVMVRGADAIADGRRFASAVIMAGTDAGSESALWSSVVDAAVAVVSDARSAEAVAARLEAVGRRSIVVRQHIRLSSTLDSDGVADYVDRLPGTGAEEAATVIVLAGVEARPSVLIGPDAGPSRWGAELDDLRQSIRQVDEELHADHVVRINELEAKVSEAGVRYRALETHAVGLQQRIDDLEGSTSWRLTTPLRWVADRARRR